MWVVYKKEGRGVEILVPVKGVQMWQKQEKRVENGRDVGVVGGREKESE